MPRTSYGDSKRSQAWTLLAALLKARGSSCSEQVTVNSVAITYCNWSSTKKPYLDVQATLIDLAGLSGLPSEQVRESLTAHLGKHLGIFEDKRSQKAGCNAGNWQFVLRLWSTDLGENQREFEALWQLRKSGGRTPSQPATNQPDSIDALVQEVRSHSGSHKTPEDPPTSLIDTLLKAFREKSIVQLEAAFKLIESCRTDSQEYQQLVFVYLFLRHKLGDYSSLEKLEDLSQDSELASRAYFWIGRCCESSRDFHKAIEAFRKSIEYLQRDEEKVRALGAISRCLLKLKNPQEAIHILYSELKNSEIYDEKYKLYESLAYIYQELKEPRIRAIALEKAVSGLRKDTEIRSELAFLYHETGLHTLSLLHYQSLLELIPDAEDFINMTGVQYERLDLTISAARAYKKAVDLGLSIAASNLFYLYLNAPVYLSVFPEEVEKFLENYKNQVDVDPNVLSALSDIRRFKDKEKDEELKHLEGAHEIQRFFLSFADRYFIEKSLCAGELTGFWHPEEDKNKMLRISSDELQIKAVFVIDFGTRDFFIGRVGNQAAVLDFSDKDVGYAYLSSDAQRLHVMKLDGYDPTFYVFVRKTVNPA